MLASWLASCRAHDRSLPPETTNKSRKKVQCWTRLRPHTSSPRPLAQVKGECYLPMYLRFVRVGLGLLVLIHDGMVTLPTYVVVRSPDLLTSLPHDLRPPWPSPPLPASLILWLQHGSAPRSSCHVASRNAMCMKPAPAPAPAPVVGTIPILFVVVCSKHVCECFFPSGKTNDAGGADGREPQCQDAQDRLGSRQGRPGRDLARREAGAHMPTHMPIAAHASTSTSGSPATAPPPAPPAGSHPRPPC